MFEPLNRSIGNDHSNHIALLTFRMVNLIFLAILITMHVRSVRVFRWEQSVSGGVLVTNIIAVGGLALCSGMQSCGAQILQTYLCGVGAILMAVNGGTIWRRWVYADQLTHAVAELLGALGMHIHRQIIVKAVLNLVVALNLLIDMAFVLFLTQFGNKR